MTDYINYGMEFDKFWDFMIENERLLFPITKLEVTRKDGLYDIYCNDYSLGVDFDEFKPEHIALLNKYGFEKI